MPVNLPDSVTHNNPAYPIVVSEDLGGTARVITGTLNNTNLIAISSFKRGAGTIIFSNADIKYYRYIGLTTSDVDWGNVSNWLEFTSSLVWSNITGTPTTLSGYGITDAVPSSRTLTINGTTYDLSANRSWTISTATPTLDQVTTAGNATSNAITVSQLFTNTAGSYSNTSITGFHIGLTNTFGYTGGITLTSDGALRNLSENRKYIFYTDSNTQVGFMGSSKITSFNSALRFGTNFGTDNWMTLFTTGNVAIGTSTDAGYKLDVVGADSRFNGVRVGLGAGGVSTNTVVGNGALSANSTGSSITAIGYRALYNNTTSGNTAVGYEAALTNTSGVNITAFGERALRNSTGSENSAFGTIALFTNTTGIQNTAVGRAALFSNSTGGTNTAVGYNALFGNSTGNSNTAIGWRSLSSNTGSNNTALGLEAGFSGVANTTGANNIFIGYQSTGVSATESNRTWIGNSSTTSTWLAGNVLIGTTTDAGYKLDVNGTAKVTSLFVGDGSSANPSITFYSENGTPNTGIYRIAENELGIAVGGLTWTFNSAEFKKDQIYLRASIGTATAPNYAFGQGYDSNGMFRPVGENTVAFSTNGTEKMRITGVGNVGFGTTTPAYRVDVQGTTLVDSSVSVQGAFNIQPLDAPPAIGGFTLSAGTNLGVGQYYYRVVYVTAIGETNASAALSVVTTTGNTTVNLTGIPVSSDPRVTARKLYRTTLNQSIDGQKFLATISNNTATTYTDSATDASLTGVTLQAYKVNTTARYFTVSGTQGMVIDSNLTALGRNAGNAIIASSGAAIRTVLIGASAGQNITTGQANVIVGVAGASITTGSENTLLGDLAGYAVNTGYGNTIIGSQTGRFLTSGHRNILIGPFAGSRLADGTTNVTTAFQNIVIGRNARFFTINDSNSIIIGDTALGLGSNTTVIGNSSTTFTAIPAGNMTIGGTVNAGYKLDVNGDIRSTRLYANVIRDSNGNNIVSTSVLNITNTDTTVGTGTTNTLTLSTKSLTGVVYVPNGNVGIATTTPGSRLGVKSSGINTDVFAVFNSANSIIFRVFNGGSGQALVDIGDNIRFRSDGALSFHDAGNFAIGTTTDAGYKLQVQGTVSAQLTNATHADQVYYNSATGELTYGAAAGGSTPTLDQVTTAGNTTTNAITVDKLTINNGTYNASIGFGLINNPTGNFFDVFFASNTGLRFGSPSFDGSAFQAFGGLHASYPGQLYFDYGSQQRTVANRSANFRNASSPSPVTVMKLTNTSNVLIGTTTDSGYKLDVNGTIRSNNVITASGGNSTDWNTAFGWGDHAAAGYITGTTGFTGVFTIPTNPPGQQNLDIQNGLIINVF